MEPLQFECSNHEPEGCVFTLNHDVVTDGYCQLCFLLARAEAVQLSRAEELLEKARVM